LITILERYVGQYTSINPSTKVKKKTQSTITNNARIKSTIKEVEI